MAFSREDAWVWDFWIADDGERYHLFYLFALKELGDPELRHRNARIGHAVSTDLTNWIDLGLAIAPGPSGAFDETATWTGCVVRDDDGLWRMFYTGSVFPSRDSATNVESIGSAVSANLADWEKQPTVLRADPRWYETLGDSHWPEEAWRDPWVFRDPHGAGWHMLITARSRVGDLYNRGVVGYAHSDDLVSWEIGPPLSAPSSDFAHLEVMQLMEMDGHVTLVFSAPRGVEHHEGPARIWTVDGMNHLGPFSMADAKVLTELPLYSGRTVRDRSGSTLLLAFELGPDKDHFLGGITDPMALRRQDGRLLLEAPAERVRR